MIVQIKDLTKTYERHNGAVKALNNLSLDIPKGSFVTITGASGSGKTTLLLMLGGLLRPSSGTMTFNGNEIDLYNEKQMASFRSKHVSYVMQSFALVPYLTALENIMLALNVKCKDKAKNHKRALELMNWVGLDERCTHYPKELSAGQQQRVAIARALANNPDILLADEPTGNLDPGLSKEVLNILRDINQKQKTTIIMVTHSPSAAEFGNLKIQLQDGKLKTSIEQEAMVMAD